MLSSLQQDDRTSQTSADHGQQRATEPRADDGDVELRAHWGALGKRSAARSSVSDSSSPAGPFAPESRWRNARTFPNPTGPQTRGRVEGPPRRPRLLRAWQISAEKTPRSAPALPGRRYRGASESGRPPSPRNRTRSRWIALPN